MATNNAGNIPTAASNKVLQGQGVGNALAFSTATYPPTATGTGKILRADGTNWSASTATYPDTATSVGKILRADGTNWSASTATYPDTATSTGKILRADGTNWSASTATYPDTATNTGAFLQADGTNFVSGNLFYITKQLTNSQIKALHGTPVQVVAAPGSGKVIVIVSNSSKMNYGGNNVFTAGASQTVSLVYATTTPTSVSQIVGNTAITASANAYCLNNPLTALNNQTVAAIENQPINAYNPVATEITGNAANDNTITLAIIYYIITI